MPVHKVSPFDGDKSSIACVTGGRAGSSPRCCLSNQIKSSNKIQKVYCQQHNETLNRPARHRRLRLILQINLTANQSKTKLIVTSFHYIRVTIFSLPKRRTFFDYNYNQPYKLFCKAGKIVLDICWTLTAFDNYILIISTNTTVHFLNLLCQ